MQGTYPFRPVEGRHIEWSPGWTRRKRDERGDPDEKREQATSKEVPNMLSLTKDILPSEIYENTIRPEDKNLVLSKSCEWVLIVGG